VSKRYRNTNDIEKAFHRDPANWRWGIFYYNKNDKRLFLPKRLSYTGWTINFAHPTAVIVIIVLVCAAIGIGIYLGKNR
jgi:uncharacterized membrane protein